ncbi:hypothetical protein ACC848_44890, partial [Rhizobium johnstonii]
LATYLIVSQLGEFYALAIVFGSAYGGVMPLYAVLAREYFGPRIICTVFGAATMLSSIWRRGITRDAVGQAPDDVEWR